MLLTLLRREPSFRRLWLGEVVSQLGDWLTYVAVSMLATSSGHGAIAVAIVFVAHNLPHALVAPLAGQLTDRFDRKMLMIRANQIQAALTFAMALAAAEQQIALVQILLFARISVGTIFMPAQSAALPRIVPAEDLDRANAATATTSHLIFALGVALGGIVVALFGITEAIVLDACTFLAANVFLYALPPLPPERSSTNENSPRTGRALEFAWKNRSILGAALAKSPLAFASGAAWVSLVETTDRLTLFAAGAMTLGMLQLSRALGSCIGPSIDLRLERRGLSVESSNRASFAVTLSGICLLASAHHPLLAFAGGVFWGVGITANWVRAQTRLQRESPDGFLGRLSAIDLLAFTSCSSAGALAGAVFGQRTHLEAGAAWFGICGSIALAIALKIVITAGTASSCQARAAPPALSPADGT